MRPIQTARPPWSSVLLVCEKCARKAGRRRFSKELKSALRQTAAHREMRVASVGCLDLCPKRRLTVATSHGLAAGQLSVLAPRIPPEEALRVLAAEQAVAAD